MQIVKVSAAVKERSNKKLKGQMTHFGGAKQFNLYQLLLWCSKKFWAVYLLLIIVLSLTKRFARPTCYQISNRSTCVILCWSVSRWETEWWITCWYCCLRSRRKAPSTEQCPLILLHEIKELNNVHWGQSAEQEDKWHWFTCWLAVQVSGGHAHVGVVDSFYHSG